jgi:hypothetical protein
MGREVLTPGGTMKSLNKFKPKFKVPNYEQRIKRVNYLADGGVADAMATANSTPNPNVRQNMGVNPVAGGPTADSAAVSNPVYPTPPSDGTKQPNANEGPLALSPMNLTQAPRVAKGGAIKMKSGGKVRGCGLAIKGKTKGRMV